MRSIKKVLLGLAAIAAVSAMTTSAFAATYDASAGSVSVEADLSSYAGTQMTVIVVAKDADDGSIAAEDILYIDQAEAADEIFQGMLVKGGSLADGDYIVKIGGENVKEIITEEFTVGGVEIVKGDVTDPAGVDMADVSAVLAKVEGSVTFTDAQTAAADVADPAGVDMADVSKILAKVEGSVSEL